MQVTGWTYWNDDRFKDVDDMSEDQFYEAKHAVAQEIKNKGYKISGESHQYIGHCVPILDNEYIYNVSMRSWGEVMRIAYDLPNENGLGYIAWAWVPPEQEVLPKGE